jgi:hypothetical protein
MYAAIRETVRGSPVISSDETGARVAGKTHWQWTFQILPCPFLLACTIGGGMSGRAPRAEIFACPTSGRVRSRTQRY